MGRGSTIVGAWAVVAMLSPFSCGADMIGEPRRYRPLQADQLQAQVESLHSQPMTLDSLEQTSLVDHWVRPASDIPLAVAPVDHPLPALPAAVAPKTLGTPSTHFVRADLNHPINILLSDDPQFRFTPRQLRDIHRVLDAVPADFLDEISAVEARRHPDLPPWSEGEQPQAMKLAETLAGRVIIYVPPMVKDVLPYAILQHYQHPS